MSVFKISVKEAGGEVEPSHHLAAIFRRIAAWLRRRFLIPLPPSLPPSVLPSLPLCFLPLEPIHWLEQCLTEALWSLWLRTLPALISSTNMRHLLVDSAAADCVSCLFFFFKPPWPTCVVRWFENVCVKVLPLLTGALKIQEYFIWINFWTWGFQQFF